MFVEFNGSGMLNGWNPANPTTANGTFSSLSYTILGVTGTTAMVTPPSINPTNPGNGTPATLNLNGGTPITLATGTAIIGSAVSIATGVPAATVELALTQAGTSFFAAPAGINEFLAAFTNNTGTYTFSAPSSTGQVNLEITGSFDESFSIVPEPASLAIMGVGLLGVAGIIRRRHSV